MTAAHASSTSRIAASGSAAVVSGASVVFAGLVVVGVLGLISPGAVAG